MESYNIYFFLIWLLPLNLIILRLTQIAAHINNLELSSNPCTGNYTLFIHTSVDGLWIVFHFWLLRKKLLWTFTYQSFVLSFFLIKHLVVACLGHIVVFKKSPNCYPKWLYYSTYLPTAWEFQLFHILAKARCNRYF